MKKFLNVILSFFILVGLVSCGDENKTQDVPTSDVLPTQNEQNPTFPSAGIVTPTVGESTPTQNTPTNTVPTEGTQTENTTVSSIENIQDATVLHAWNWSMNTLKSKMSEIAEAGYLAIQTSPMQPQKDYYANSTWKDQWWKLYQPFGFEIATKDNAIGTKDELIEMCNEAEKYGIKVIVDVVANHLAGNGTSSFSPKVKDYSPDIYNQNLQHNAGSTSDNSVKDVVQGTIGDFPDLKTESSVVQNEVLNLLKDYIDCGVDGFRFDAAKHIETPDDGQYASNFWPYVLNGASSYASSKGLDEPYYYGEILYTPGPNRSYSSYTKYMSITDNVTSKDIRNAVLSQNAAAAANSNYATGVPANKIMLWAESHDTYSNSEQETTKISATNINKIYAITASRANASSLYFARPGDYSKMGEMGSSKWKAKEVAEVNKFHNFFIGTNEYLGSSNGYFTNTRYDGTNCGAVIVNLKGTSSTVSNLAISQMKDGKYIDQITGNEFTVSNGKISGTIGGTGIAVVYNKTVSNELGISVNDNNVIDFYDSLKVKVTVSNASSAHYTINNGSKVGFTSSTTIDLSKENTGNITITITAIKDSKEITETLTYKKLAATESRTIVFSNIDSTHTNNRTIYAWVWKTGSEGKWVKGELNVNTFTFNVEKGYDNYVLASFNKNAEADWNNKISQTADGILTEASKYEGSSLSWK